MAKRKTKKKQTPPGVIPIVCIMAFCVLLFVAVIGFGGEFGNVSRYLLFGTFGIFAYIAPLGIAYGTYYYLIHAGEKYLPEKYITSVSLYMIVALLLELFLHKDSPIGGMEGFKIGHSSHAGGGFVGGLLSGWFVHIFGVAGTYIIAFAGLAICLAILTDGTAFDFLRSGQKKRNDKKASASKGRVRPKVLSKSRGESDDDNDKDLSYNNKHRPIHSGVTLDTNLGAAATASGQNGSDEISEINYMGEEPSDIDASDDTKETEWDIPEEEIKKEPPRQTQRSDPDEPLGSFLSESEDKDEDAVLDERIEKVLKDEPVRQKACEAPKQTSEKKTRSRAVEEQPKTESVTEGFTPQAAASNSDYVFPTTDLLSLPPAQKGSVSERGLDETKIKLEQILANFGVDVTVTDASCGPTVTRYELQPQMGVKVSKIVNLADDIKLNLAAADIRIEAPIPGKAAVGIEVPNETPAMVSFRELVESEEFAKEGSPIAFAAGKDIGGKTMIANIAKMPHVLIAGATGSGKSVCINTIIMSILFRAHPDDVKFIMIDPKVVELSVYNGIPHLLIPVVTDPKKAAGALNWAVNEMMERYDRFAKVGVRNMEGYNSRISGGHITYESGGEEITEEAARMPQIIVIVDELADLMMVASKEVEESICRLAQLARAAGIHLVIATQRPSVNVITGLIKANMPSRIAFAVTSGVDSRTILDMVGAEKLLGKGDMLYYPQGYTKPVRSQGAFVSDKEVAKVVDFIKHNNGQASYDENITTNIAENALQSGSESQNAVAINPGKRDDGRDAYFEEAARLLIDKEKGSIGMLQRYFKIGFNRAARIMDQLEEAGVVGPEVGTKPRSIIMTLEEFEGTSQDEDIDMVEE